MYKDSSIYYPQSEMTTMMVPVTTGCQYNKCVFCTMYRDDEYSEVPLSQIRQQLMNGYEYTEKVFLTGADPLFIGYEKMKAILEEVREYLPYCARVASYASIRSVSKYSKEELSELHDLGLRLLYIGFESGSDEYLSLMNKGHRVENAIEQAKKLNEAHLAFNTIILIGIGGAGSWKENALKTAKMINQFQTNTLITMCLILMEGSELSDLVDRGEYSPSSNQEKLLEIRTLIENLDPEKPMSFDTTHPSNIIKMEGTLPDQRERLLKTVSDRIGIE